MIPKISDFGLARIFPRTETQANTQRPSGTHGYMSPEYSVSGIYSTKSDVFSFGVMVLEIVTGKQNRTFSYLRSHTNLLSLVWRSCRDGNWSEVIDEIILDSSPPLDQVRRCIEIGLLCVQQMTHDRPSMSNVVSLLDFETLQIPIPNHLGSLPMAKHLLLPPLQSCIMVSLLMPLCLSIYARKLSSRHTKNKKQILSSITLATTMYFGIRLLSFCALFSPLDLVTYWTSITGPDI
ncbi:hypothetical protein EUTSA_v10002088mg [Eutrema salsugineum]|uniref:Protein kinase domain-containing protein n=1 Tax=Eutrema salsugineum TaxID=72664 RepID=V4M2I2_EUTSA|nr:hypothetical protein EUTSA_v10002088mg [Eutrema salsugineum]